MGNIKVDKKMMNENTMVTKVINEETGEERISTLHRDHPKPSNRREFLASGLLGFSGMVVAPSIINVLSSPAFAADTSQCSVQGVAMPGFITLNLSGGAHLSGELPPLGEDRLPLAGIRNQQTGVLHKYDLLGLGIDDSVFTDPTRGRDMFQGVRVAGTGNAGVPAGFFWLGLSLRAAQSTLDKTTLLSVAVSSNDDTDSNMADASGMILAAGATGELLPNLGNDAGTGTGVGQTAALVRPAAPLLVRSYADLEGALKPAGTLATRLTDSRRQKLLQLVNSLSGTQARTVAAAGGATGVALQRVVECATGKNIEISATADPGIDPGLNTGVAGLWGIAPGNKTGANYARAAMVYSTLLGKAATTGIDLGGHDSHGNGRANQNNLMQQAGETLGRILETAAILGKPLMIHVVSDGSQSSGSGSAFGADFNNDSGSRGMNYILAFNPVARPKVKTDMFKHQIGFFTNGQGASDQSVVGTPIKGAVAVLANYLAMAGQMQKLDAIAPGVFSRADLDEVVRLG